MMFKMDCLLVVYLFDTFVHICKHICCVYSVNFLLLLNFSNLHALDNNAIHTIVSLLKALFIKKNATD